MKQKDNYVSALLNISCDLNFAPEVQLNAAIQLKNFISGNWKYGIDNNINKQLQSINFTCKRKIN